jgi:hypothetical protein
VTEATSRLFDDSGLGDELDRPPPVFGMKVDALLRQLGSSLRQLDEFQAPRELLLDPHMKTIRQLAGEALSLLA